ncbi:hypothetical protein [Emticicia sp. SJ17W-69]|uniref:hypothetical protein n=1 Tax=Emticicia sp. SJ17W-69 TaxID=3421657 RepID=UPI003EB6D720
MKAVANINTNIQLTFSQITDIAKQLPKKQKAKLVSILVKEREEEEEMTKAELVARIKEGLEEVKLYKEGKIKLRTLKEFLEDV